VEVDFLNNYIVPDIAPAVEEREYV